MLSVEQQLKALILLQPSHHFRLLVSKQLIIINFFFFGTGYTFYYLELVKIHCTFTYFIFPDGVLIVIWLLFAIGGYRSQQKLSANRSPFPPVCCNMSEQTSETVPILSNARFPTYT